MARGSEESVGAKAREALPSWRVTDVLGKITSVAEQRGEVEGLERLGELAFHNNETVWKAILDSVDATENVHIDLHEFWVSEWLPLRPGLFHTDNALYSRREAIARSTINLDDTQAPAPLRRWLLGQVKRTAGGHSLQDHTRVFDPHGKMNMIDGGIGCIRLKPLQQRKTHRWLLGASSTGVVHEGLPVALDDPTRDRLIRDIRRWGALQCRISGTLRFVPSEDTMAQTYARGIQQLYLEVDRVEPTTHRRDDAPPIEVTAIATFASRSEEFPGLNASYVTFEAGVRGQLEEATDWLENIYVQQSYGGRVLTDFDEQTRRFENAAFSLAKILNGLAKREETSAALEELQLGPYDRAPLLELFERRGFYIAGDAYFVNKAAAVGRNAQASNTVFRDNDKK